MLGERVIAWPDPLPFLDLRTFPYSTEIRACQYYAWMVAFTELKTSLDFGTVSIIMGFGFLIQTTNFLG